jgi:co-chaperonin GroES (HSP10)
MSKKKTDYGLTDAFPEVDCNETPLGDCIIVQLKLAPKKLESGLYLAQETIDQESYDNTVGKVILIGPDAFKYFNKEDGTLKKWPGERWYQVGDYVRIPKHPRTGFFKRVTREYKESRTFKDDDGYETVETVTEKDNITFCILQEAEILSKIIDPLKELTINK